MGTNGATALSFFVSYYTCQPVSLNMGLPCITVKMSISELLHAKVIYTLIDSINIPLIILHWARNSEAGSDAKKVCTPKSVYVEPSWIICSWCLHWLLYDRRYTDCFTVEGMLLAIAMGDVCYMTGFMMGGMLCTLPQGDLMLNDGTWGQAWAQWGVWTLYWLN